MSAPPRGTQARRQGIWACGAFVCRPPDLFCRRRRIAPLLFQDYAWQATGWCYCSSHFCPVACAGGQEAGAEGQRVRCIVCDVAACTQAGASCQPRRPACAPSLATSRRAAHYCVLTTRAKSCRPEVRSVLSTSSTCRMARGCRGCATARTRALICQAAEWSGRVAAAGTLLCLSCEDSSQAHSPTVSLQAHNLTAARRGSPHAPVRGGTKPPQAGHRQATRPPTARRACTCTCSQCRAAAPRSPPPSRRCR
jgi:hypothetical protein